jgi:transcriptional regulator with XRE-family HTH domain
METTSGGKELKRLRQVAGLSQSELCKLTGIARSRISSAECGYCELTDGETARADRVIRGTIVERYKGIRSVVEGGSAVPSDV